jgi:hypothetical protein
MVDPSQELADLVRATLSLGPEASVSIMQMNCGCPVPDCGEVETQIMFARPDLEEQPGRWQRVRLAKSMRSVTAEDLRMALAGNPDAWTGLA